MLQSEPAVRVPSDLRPGHVVAVGVASTNVENMNGGAFSRPGPPILRAASRRQMTSYGAD